MTVATVAEDLFETIDCPLCGEAGFEVVRASRYPPHVTVEDIQRLYSASSAHVLMDQVVSCRACSMHYVNPRPSAQLIIGSYEDAVDPTFVAQNAGRIATFRRALRRVLARLGESGGNGRRLLDIGCAGGAFPAAARDLGFQPSGVEPSRWLADFGRRTYGLDIRDGILQPGMFPEPSFDVITLWDVIEHVPQPRELLSLIARLLKPAGLLLVNYPDVDSVAAHLLGSRWPFWLSVHLLYYSRKTIGKQLTRAGFSPLWFESFWPQLPFGYVLQRTAPYFPPASLGAKLVNGTGIGRLPFTYNMGQTLVVARKGAG
jgi:SAM-dependent methyltransferase